MTSSLVGSEMCIRDSIIANWKEFHGTKSEDQSGHHHDDAHEDHRSPQTVSYTHLTLPTICSV
eukprot:872711-Prorocentrum_lima.AAC.1